MAKRSRYDDIDNKPKSDAYTGLLALSLLAMVASCVILYMDYAQYGNTKAPAPTVPPVTKPPANINQAPSTTQAPGNLPMIAAEPLLPTITGEPIVPVKGEMPAEGPALGSPD